MRGRRRPPEPVIATVAAAGGGSDERIRGWAQTDGGQVVVTDRGLYAPGVGRVEWLEVFRASWKTPTLEVLVGGRAHHFDLPEPGAVPAVVHERVTATVVSQTHVQLSPAGGARLVARRIPGDGQIVWRVVFDAGLDPADPGLRAAADEALAHVRAATGL